jgi:diacylglycerol kinase family enzyme
MQTKPFSRLVIIRNPASTRAARMNVRIGLLKKAFPGLPCTILDTVSGGAEANQAMLRDHLKLLGPHTLLGIAAGDGTVHLVINFLLNDPAASRGAHQTPLLPLWGGNANDLANMLNGPYLPGIFLALRRQGQVISIRPMRCKLQFADGARLTIIAGNYASFGATAAVARQLNGPEHRHHSIRRFIPARPLLDALTTVKALVRSPRFEVEEAGRRRRVYEKIFANGPRFAKLNLMPARLARPTFYAHTFEHKRFFTILSRLVGSLRRHSADHFLMKRVSFTILSPVTAQFDGETMDLPPGTKVTVKRSLEPFYAYTRHKDKFRD